MKAYKAKTQQSAAWFAAKQDEHNIQSACVSWFNCKYRNSYKGLLFAVPNGGRRDKVTAGKLKAEGVVAGVADLVLLVPNDTYHALLIEMKTEVGRQAPSQKRWQKLAERHGYKYALCRSLDAFVALVEDYLAGVEKVPQKG